MPLVERGWALPSAGSPVSVVDLLPDLPTALGSWELSPTLQRSMGGGQKLRGKVAFPGE